MNKSIKVLEGIKAIYFSNCPIHSEALDSAIQKEKLFEEARSELGTEIIDIINNRNPGDLLFEYVATVQIFYKKAQAVVAKLKKENEELKEKLKDSEHFAQDMIDTGADFEIERDKFKARVEELEQRLNSTQGMYEGLKASNELNKQSLSKLQSQLSRVTVERVKKAILKHYSIEENGSLVTVNPKEFKDIERAAKIECFLTWFMTDDLATTLVKNIKGE